jgi:nitroreductase
MEQTFNDLVFSRRSVRLYEQVSVPEEVIERALDLALLAPNSSNLQPWEFYWVQSPDKKKRLVEACLSQAAAVTAAELIVCVARTRTWKRNCQNMCEQMAENEKSGVRIPPAAWDYYKKIVPWVYEQGPLGVFGVLKRILIWAIGLRRPISREPFGLSEMKLWATKSTALACENFMLAIKASGYDSCPMEGMDSRRIKRILNLPPDALIPMVIAVGKARPRGITLPRIRAPRDWFIRRV